MVIIASDEESLRLSLPIGGPAPSPTDEQAEPMTDSPPDRLSNNPASPFHDAAALERGVGIRLNGVEKTTVEEYCVSEGWIRVAVGKTRDRRGNPLTFRLNGSVEPYFRDAAAPDAGITET